LVRPDVVTELPSMNLEFLPLRTDWPESFAAAKDVSGAKALHTLRDLANCRLSLPQLGRLDRAIQQALKDPESRGSFPTIRLAIVGSSTTSHLPAAIRVASLRHGLIVDIYEGPYGMYMQELSSTESALHAFKPDVLLIALDAHHLADAPTASADSALLLIEQCWAMAQKHLRCTVLQQTVLPVFAPRLGNNEQLLTQSPAAIVDQINAGIRKLADGAGVHLVTLDSFFRPHGLSAWFEPALWFKSKHEVHPRASIIYGDQVARELAALRGLSSKCLVLDLDNTLWGGVIGDDGLDGIVLGQGGAVGEAYLSFQRYCAALSSRGIILAVCSKNDEANARLPFREHPEMVLRENDIACFVANWNDKATNLRTIAATLNIGIDSLVFADDNPAERQLIRKELPAVQVPELPEDPALYADMIANAGYFEGLTITAEDQERGRQYLANSERARLLEQVTDVESYLQGLAMELTLEPFNDVNIARTTQLINKTNQFNVTTRRYVEAEIRALMKSPDVITLTARLADRFGDNGLIAIIIANQDGPREVHIDTWLMSCRVLGRRVEEACLNALVAACRSRGVDRLIGVYKPTEKNQMVRDLYPRLGFQEIAHDDGQGERRFMLETESYAQKPVPMKVNNLLEALPVIISN
jgi:FkbH-like protein